MSEQLNPSDLLAQADGARQVARELMDKIGILQAELRDLVENGAKTVDIDNKKAQIQDTNTRISETTICAVKLHTQGMENILVSTNLANAKEGIEKATEKVLEKVKQLDDIRKIFKAVDLFIRLGGAVVSAAITGNPVAQIKAIVQAIDEIA